MKKLLFTLMMVCISAGMYATDYFVDASIATSGDGLTWETAKKTITEAVTASGTTAANIYVAAGTYTENLGSSNTSHISYYGGYPVGNLGTDISNRNITSNITIIDGEATRKGVTITRASYVVDGFTIQNCASGANSLGGAVSLTQNSTIQNCIIKNSSLTTSNAKWAGAGVYMSNGTIEDCEIFGNSTQTSGSGAGVYIAGGTLQRCKIYNNTAGTLGGGVLVGNKKSSAIDKELANDVVVANCLIYNNSKEGLYVSSVATNVKTVNLINNTVVNNSLPIVITDAATPTAMVSGANNIFYNNTNDETFTPGTAFTYNAIQAASVTGTGNIAKASGNQANLFTVPTATTGIIAVATSNWLPISGSGLYNVGNNTPVVAGTDIAGNTRIQQTTVDLGALETSLSSGATPTISTTGTLSALSTTYGTASSTTSFSVSGADMTAGISVNPPIGFQVSTTSDFSSNVGTNGSPITVDGSGTIASTPIYVRLASSTAVGNYSGNIVLSSTGATSVNVATVSSTVSAGSVSLNPGTGNSVSATDYTVEELANSDLVVSSGEFIVDRATVNVQSIIIAPTAKLSLGTNALNATNGITLQSSASGTATLTGDNAVSNATVEQHVTAGRNWYVSPSVTLAAYSTLNLGKGGVDGIVAFNEGTKAWDNVTSGTLVPGKGYIQVANASLPGTTGTVNFTGTTNAGDVTTPSLTRTGVVASSGFNLVGNPYPSYIRWSGINSVKKGSTLAIDRNTGVGSSFWYRTKRTGDDAYIFVTHNGTSGYTIPSGTANTTITGIIPPMQAFWVLVNDGSSPTTMTFTNDMRQHADDAGNKFKAPRNDERQRLRLQLANGSNTDEALIYFDAAAQNAFDDYDSPKMMNNSETMPDLYSKTGAEKLVINGLSSVNDNMELPLGFGLKAAGSFTLKATELSNFAADTNVYLLDKERNTQTELTAGSEYSFSTTAATTANESRFALLFRAPGATTGINPAETETVSVFVNAASQIVINANAGSKYAIYNAMGQQIENGVLNYKLQTANYKLQTGVYVVRVSNQSRRVIIK